VIVTRKWPELCLSDLLLKNRLPGEKLATDLSGVAPHGEDGLTRIDANKKNHRRRPEQKKPALIAADGSKEDTENPEKR